MFFRILEWCGDRIKRADRFLNKDKERKTIPIQIGKKQRRFGFSRGNNEEIFLVNNLLFCKCWESEEKGILWHIWEEELGEFVIFEDIVPLKQTDLVRGNSFETEMLFDKPGKANDIQYLDGELSLRESYRENEDETGSAVFSFQMPLFGSEIQGREQINRVMQGVEQLALKDREDFFQEVQEVKEAGYEDCGNWFKTYGYSNLYVGEQYISFYCYIRTYDGGIRPWEEAIPLTFNRETGEYLTMDELFTVNRNAYMKRLSSAVYKYAELSGEEYFWNEGFDQNVLVKEFKPYCFYLTLDGIVLCYGRYEVAPGAAGDPAFEIPYTWFEDIFIGE